jgi:uncharacterized protein DUF6316
MSHNRRGELPERHSRSDRIVFVRGRWYVVTRERVDVGPFATKEDAELAAAHLGQALDGIDEPVVAIALISEFVRRRTALPANDVCRCSQPGAISASPQRLETTQAQVSALRVRLRLGSVERERVG